MELWKSIGLTSHRFCGNVMNGGNVRVGKEIGNGGKIVNARFKRPRQVADLEVRYPTRKLTGDAKRWWQSRKDLLILDLRSEHAVTWEIFRDEFHKQFFHRVVQEAKAKEFMDLVQGSMAVIEYATKFIQLSRFTVYLIPDEEKKAKNFKRGLSPSVKTMMRCFDIHYFTQLVDGASMYEESLKENAAALAEHTKRTFVLGVSS
ncbi:uncharacterized protein LOC133871583 [Alnus glutinosa]|uniref:uncharacterized protein LOC133871583 n=1 Tax=Alnus glutinosa TaxID=3517 RepID=UPI002D78C76E|nr:uncharacterized protein LOC133871583 [Alnus glutinosa]